MILLDTHVLLWWINDPNKLSKKAKKLIEETTKQKIILVSSFSVWEICLLVKKGRLGMAMDINILLKKIESLPFIQFIPVDNNIAALSVNLADPLHNDPADRIIIATALLNGATLITADSRILKYPQVKTLW